MFVGSNEVILPHTGLLPLPEPAEGNTGSGPGAYADQPFFLLAAPTVPFPFARYRKDRELCLVQIQPVSRDRCRNENRDGAPTRKPPIAGFYAFGKI